MDTRDTITIEVHRKAIENLVNEMALTLVRTSGSPVVTDAKDFSTCLLDTDGEQLGFAAYVLLHSASSWLGTKSVIDDLKQAGVQPEPGDGWIVNDPHTGGALHQGDVGIVMPTFVDDQLRGWVFSNCHVLDIGGSGVSGVAPSATTVYEEGLRFPPTRIIRNGKIEPGWERYIAANVRVAPLVLNDIRSMIAANNTGQKELATIIHRYGVERHKEYCRVNKELTETLFRKRIAGIPDGVYESVAFCEYDGHGPDQLLEVKCSLTVDGSDLRFRFEGAVQVDAFVNCCQGQVYGAVMSAILARFGYGDLPFNAGMWRPLEIDMGELGSIVNATEPAPVSLGHAGTGSRITRTVTNVFNQAISLSEDPVLRSRASGEAADTTNLQGLFGMSDSGVPALVFHLDSCSGTGGPAQTVGDGQDCYGMVAMSGCGIADIEVHESRDPVIFLWRRIQPNCGGPGQFRGGQALDLAYWLRSAETLDGMININDPELPASGSLGGSAAGGANQYPIRATDVEAAMSQGHDTTNLDILGGQAEPARAREGHFTLRRGDVLRCLGGGGSGLGDPLLRAPALVVKDYRDGYITAAHARSAYGVVINGDGVVDTGQTENLRADVRRERIGSAPRRKPAQPDVSQPSIQVRRDEGQQVWTCGQCDTVLGQASEDWRLVGTVLREEPIAEHYQRLGMSVRERREAPLIMLREYFCPECAGCLATDVLPDGVSVRSPRLTSATR